MTPFASSINSVLQTHLSLCGPSRASVSMIAACQCSLFVFVGAHYYMFSFASAQIDDLYGGNWQVKDVSRARIFPKHFPEIKFVIRPRYSRDVAADERQLTASFFFASSFTLFFAPTVLLVGNFVGIVSATIFHFPQRAAAIHRMNVANFGINLNVCIYMRFVWQLDEGSGGSGMLGTLVVSPSLTVNKSLFFLFENGRLEPGTWLNISKRAQ